jgi:hypothetical protein
MARPPVRNQVEAELRQDLLGLGSTDGRRVAKSYKAAHTH